MVSYDEIELQMAAKYGLKIETTKALGDFMLDENHAVNVKSNNVEKANYSPNIVSARRLLKWLKEGKAYSLLFVDYRGGKQAIEVINESGLVDIKTIDWSSFTIEAQGWGVIQMPNELKIQAGQTEAQFWAGFRSAYQSYVDKQRVKLDTIERTLIPQM